MKQKHSPLPWITVDRSMTDLFTKDGYHICSTGGYSDNFSDDGGLYRNIANAAFIVRAVNSHDTLVEALKDAMSALSYVRACHGDLYGVGFDRVGERSIKALREAGEE